MRYGRIERPRCVCDALDGVRDVEPSRGQSAAGRATRAEARAGSVAQSIARRGARGNTAASAPCSRRDETLGCLRRLANRCLDAGGNPRFN